MSTMAATDGLKDARSLRGKAAAQRKLRKAVGAWFDALEARQLLTAALQTTVLEDTQMVGLPPEIIADPTLTLQTAWGTGSTTPGTVRNNPATGEITFTPNANYNTPAGQTNKLFYQLSNGQTYAWEFQVLDVNDGPTFDMPSSVDAVEDSGNTYEFGPIATDPASASNSFVKNLGVGPSDESSQSIVSVTAAAKDSSYFEVQPTIAAVYQKDAEGKDVLDKDGHRIFLGYKLSFKLAANKSGTAKVDVTVTDSGAVRDGRGDVNATTKTLEIKIADTNDPVQVGTIIVAPDATEDVKYTFELPTNAFTDIDPDEALQYTVQGLPSWLNFVYNSTSKKWEFTGTPGNGNVGSSTITVTAIDKGGTTASQTFTLRVLNANDAPIVDPMVGLIDQEVTQGQDPTQWSYQIPAGLFYDIDADDQGQLTYTVTRGDQALPDVLQYDAATRTLTLKRSPLNGDVGVYSLVVKATDSHGATTSSSAFKFTVKDVNDVPTVANP
ncbi:MAG TPA: putative Ig domain-containing protein, partial [Tepidisphaeraceae bacterium]|nr:putative Ig domain-containing protein [Tepidisphaeraceae bacterium]